MVGILEQQNPVQMAFLGVDNSVLTLPNVKLPSTSLIPFFAHRRTACTPKAVAANCSVTRQAALVDGFVVSVTEAVHLKPQGLVTNRWTGEIGEYALNA